MKQIKEFICKKPILTALILMVVSLLAINYVAVFFETMFNDLTSGFLTEAILAALMLYLIYLINGPGELRFSLVGIGYGFKLVWSLILLNILFGAANVIRNLGYVNTEYGPPILVAIEIAAYMLCVGFFEEGLYRGFVLSGFLEKDGDTFKGVLKACIYSSLLFGVSHVVYDIIGFFSDPASISLVGFLQIVLKTLQTAIFGFVYSVIYLRNHNLWNIAIFHALGDYVTIMPNYLLVNNATKGYVAEGSAGSLNILAYLIIMALMLPAGIYAYFQLKQVKLPQWGLFKEKWHPLNVHKTNK